MSTPFEGVLPFKVPLDVQNVLATPFFLHWNCIFPESVDSAPNEPTWPRRGSKVLCWIARRSRRIVPWPSAMLTGVRRPLRACLLQFFRHCFAFVFVFAYFLFFRRALG